MPFISGKNIPNTFWISFTTPEKVSEKLTKQLNLIVYQSSKSNKTSLIVYLIAIVGINKQIFCWRSISHWT